jgi:hypothetical protein
MEVTMRNSSTVTRAPLKHASSRSVESGTQVLEQNSARFCKAGLLDLPFIFNQIMDGSVEGVYSDLLLARGGNVHLFKLLFVNLLPFGRLLGKRKIYDFMMFSNGSDEIGFAGMHTDSKGARVIGFFGIDMQFRGKRNGALMLRTLIESYPANTRIEAYTTKYAAGMQRLLSQAGFRQSNEDATSKQRLYFLDKR